MAKKESYKNAYVYAAAMDLLGFEKGIIRLVKDLNLDLTGNIRILDAGCGTGILGLTLLKRLPHSTLLATDIDDRFVRTLLKRARREGISRGRISAGVSDISNPAKVKAVDGSVILLEPGSFDIVCVGAAAGFARDQKRTIRRFLGLLKPHGYFIDIEMSEGPLGRLVSFVSSYPVLPLKSIKKAIEAQGCRASLRNLSSRYFPANLTRVCMIARKAVLPTVETKDI